MISQSETAETFRVGSPTDSYFMGGRTGSYPNLAARTLPAPSRPKVPDRAPRLFFTIGAQRSGKSTLARKWLHREVALGGFEDDGYPRFVWDTDALRLELYDRPYCREGESMTFAIKRYAIATALRVGHDVMVAGTHSSASSIRRVLEIRRDAIPILVDTPMEVCLKRAVETGQDYLLGVIPRVFSQVQGIARFGPQKYVSWVLEDMDDKVPY